MSKIFIDFESGKQRVISLAETNTPLIKFVELFSKNHFYPNVVQFVDGTTGETIKGPRYDTTKLVPTQYSVEDFLKPCGVKQKRPIEPVQQEPRDRINEFRTQSNIKKQPIMNEIQKFKSLVQECMVEIKTKNNPRFRLKESLRPLVKNILKEFSNVANTDKSKDETEIERKGYFKDGNVRVDKSNEKQCKEIETIVHGIDPTWDVYWDDHNQLIVRAQNLLYVRICPKYENNYDIDAMVKLVDRVRAIAQTWDQVKAFVKANFSNLKNTTNADNLHKKSIDNYEDREVIKKAAGPENDVIKNRGQKKNGEDAKIKDTKKADKDYNEPMTKRDEDMPDQPMKQVTEPGKDPEGKNKNIKKTDKVKPPKHKTDKKLKVSDKKTSKFKPSSNTNN